MTKEDKYILKRRIKAALESIPFYICRIFPIKRNKVVCWTLEGNGGYADSPKYIAEELRRRGGYEIVWLTNHPEKDFPEDMKLAKYTHWSRAYHLTTAAWWISNTRSVYGTKKRRDTRYIMTWHAIAGIKPIGAQRGDRLPKMARIVSEYDSAMIDFVPYGNEWFKREYPDGLFFYGKMLPTGTPRCDILFHGQDAMKQKYVRLFNLPQDAKIMLYAPTFRGGSQKADRSVSAELCTLDIGKAVKALEERFEGKWYVFLRLHPQVAEKMSKMPVLSKSDRAIDVSQLADISELLAASDAYISDYSSPFFEYAIMEKPAFFYVEDYEEYVADRGQLCFDIEHMPFPFATDMDGLIDNITGFDEDNYRRECRVFRESLGLFENGKASAKVADVMEDKGIET